MMNTSLLWLTQELFLIQIQSIKILGGIIGTNGRHGENSRTANEQQAKH